MIPYHHQKFFQLCGCAPYPSIIHRKVRAADGGRRGFKHRCNILDTRACQPAMSSNAVLDTRLPRLQSLRSRINHRPWKTKVPRSDDKVVTGSRAGGTAQKLRVSYNKEGPAARPEQVTTKPVAAITSAPIFGSTTAYVVLLRGYASHLTCNSGDQVIPSVPPPIHSTSERHTR